MANWVAPTQIDAVNSAGSLRADLSDWRSVGRFHVGTGQREPTIDAGYTTACASNKPNLSISFLCFLGESIYERVRILRNSNRMTSIMTQRPTFKKPNPTASVSSPEDLFYALSGRAKTHAYLRGPQQDALREYAKSKDAPDIAFELPTGSGKTTVGLLIAEWHRRKSKGRTAFLTLTNQLAGQVIEEARSLGIPVADLRGSKERRSRSEEASFLDGSAVAVSTYSNLFNTKPIIDESEVIVFDDAHSGGEFAATMWTLRIGFEDNEALGQALWATCASLMTETQRVALCDASTPNQVELVDFGLSPAAREQLINVLDSYIQPYSSLWYAWSQIKANIHACILMVSKYAIILRPYITPTFTHSPFCNAKHRIYLTATLGDAEDLKRAYAIEKLITIRAAQNQDGRRFVFVPELFMGQDQTWEAIGKIWPNLDPQRTVLIAPSFNSLNQVLGDINSSIGSFGFVQYGASDIEESLDSFTTANNAVLALANRYDGLDLPDDDCRLLMLNESPRATNELEANLANVWKLGPALRWREATRLVQGMGRCTRNATDFAVILLLGQSLVNAATNNALLRLLSPTLQAEIMWGKAQLRDLKLDPAGFADMVAGLISDEDYRQGAGESILEHAATSPPLSEITSLNIAEIEVAHAKAYWLGDFTRANEIGRIIADRLSGNEWAGYRSWWLYLASLAARYSGNQAAEEDALRRAKGTGVNAGWLDHVIRLRSSTPVTSSDSTNELGAIIAERIWTALDELGWSGKRFLSFSEKMIADLGNIKNHRAFHQGLVALGKLLGAQADAPSQQGDPDVIWRLGDSTWVCFEAKSEKLEYGNGISKKDLLQAKGHVEWVKFFETQGKKSVQVVATIVAPIDKLQPSAEPHCENVYFVGTKTIGAWAESVRTSLLELRAKFSGCDFAAARELFIHDLSRLSLDIQSTLATVKATPMS